MGIFDEYLNSTPQPAKKGFASILGTSIKQGIGDFWQGSVAGPAKAITTPFLKTAGSGIREIQSIPSMLQGDYAKSKEIASRPLFGQNTFEGSTNLQNLGSAGEVASLLFGGGAIAGGVKGQVLKTGFKGAGIGGVGSGSNYLANTEDPTALGFIGHTAGGAVLGGGVGLAGGALAARNPQIRANKLIAQRQAELDKLDRLQTLKKTVEKGRERGIDIKKVLSETDVLHGSVDNTGSITTKGSGGAVEQYTKEFIDGNEKIVSEILKKEGRSIAPQMVEKKLTEAVMKSGIEGDALVQAKKKIQRELAGYAMRARTNTAIPVATLHDAKVDKYNNINFFTESNTKKYDKTIAKALKELVESETKSVNVKNINKELSKHFAVIDYLEKLDGKKVDGGKLGKYFAQTVGAIVGSHFGPLGTIAGAEAGSRIKGSTMASTFSGKTGKSFPQAEAITDAIKFRESEPLRLQSSNSLGSRQINQAATNSPTNIGINNTVLKTNGNVKPKNIGQILPTALIGGAAGGAAAVGTVALGSKFIKPSQASPPTDVTPGVLRREDQRGSVFAPATVDTIPNKHNNPGAIQYDKTSEKWLKYFGAEKDGRFAKFPNVESGIDAIRHVLTENYAPETTVKKALFTWTGSGLEGIGYKPEDVRLLGSKKLGELTEAEMNQLIYGIAKFEGFKQLDKLKKYLKI